MEKQLQVWALIVMRHYRVRVDRFIGSALRRPVPIDYSDLNYNNGFIIMLKQ